MEKECKIIPITDYDKIVNKKEFDEVKIREIIIKKTKSF